MNLVGNAVFHVVGLSTKVVRVVVHHDGVVHAEVAGEVAKVCQS